MLLVIKSRSRLDINKSRVADESADRISSLASGSGAISPLGTGETFG